MEPAALNSSTKTFLYDARGNLIQTTDAQGLVTRTVYNDNGRAFFTTDRNGITATRTEYDPAGRATNVVRYTNAVVTIEAGPKSTLTSAGTAIATNSTEYLPSGWVKSRTSPDGTTSYEYYPDGQLMRTIDAQNHTNFYAYDAGGRQQYVVDALNHTNSFQYDAVGRLIKTVFHDGTFTTNLFNNLGQRVGVKDQAANSTVASESACLSKSLASNPIFVQQAFNFTDFASGGVTRPFSHRQSVTGSIASDFANDSCVSPSCRRA